jgi:hypothetical protein
MPTRTGGYINSGAGNDVRIIMHSVQDKTGILESVFDLKSRNALQQNLQESYTGGRVGLVG